MTTADIQAYIKADKKAATGFELVNGGFADPSLHVTQRDTG